MTTRNETSMYFAAMIVSNSERVNLGHCDPAQMNKRIFATLAANLDIQIDNFTIFASRTKEGLEQQIKRGGGVQAEYAHEGLNPDSPLYGLDESVIKNMIQIDDDTPSPFEGITMNRLMEANTSPEFEAYRTLACSPEKRVGVESGFIEALREAWHVAYPDVAKRIPPWKE